MACKCIDDVEKQSKDIEEHSFAWEMLKQYSASNKRLFTALIVVIVLWFCTMGGFVWLWNQYDYSTTTTTTTTQSYDSDANSGNAAYNSGNGGVNF